jgi:uncharacterized protein YdhG (YjbR/CyaY superfamily)
MKYNNIDEYINMFPKDIQQKLEQLRQTIKKAAPLSQETISYQMPAFKINKTVVAYFAVCKEHIGFYPTPSPIIEFKKELSKYKTSKGAVQLPINEPLPLDLIKKMVEYKIKGLVK